jgi:hypothetical protein
MRMCTKGRIRPVVVYSHPASLLPSPYTTMRQSIVEPKVKRARPRTMRLSAFFSQALPPLSSPSGSEPSTPTPTSSGAGTPVDVPRTATPPLTPPTPTSCPLPSASPPTLIPPSASSRSLPPPYSARPASVVSLSAVRPRLALEVHPFCHPPTPPASPQRTQKPVAEFEHEQTYKRAYRQAYEHEHEPAAHTRVIQDVQEEEEIPIPESPVERACVLPTCADEGDECIPVMLDGVLKCLLCDSIPDSPRMGKPLPQLPCPYGGGDPCCPVWVQGRSRCVMCGDRMRLSFF